MRMTVIRQSHGLGLATAKTTPDDIVTTRNDAVLVVVVVVVIVILLEGAFAIGPAVVSVL